MHAECSRKGKNQHIAAARRSAASQINGMGNLIIKPCREHKVERQRIRQPNFQYGNAIFGCMGSSKEASQKHLIMTYEQLLSSVFSCFQGLIFFLIF